VNFSATIINAVWAGISAPAYVSFRRALRDPAAAQARRLQYYLGHNAQTAFGKAHGLENVSDYADFARRVPLSDYDSIKPWIERIHAGDANVLTRDRVTHLMPTSGSSGARKLIPFTPTLQREFNGAVATWVCDLSRRQPGLMCGPAYWSITPVLNEVEPEPSAVPIGFATDAAYLGGTSARLIDAVMAVPEQVRHAGSIDAFRYATLLSLLRCRDLRLISVWHPSFLSLLLDSLQANWDRLLRDIASGGFNHAGDFPANARNQWITRPNLQRARELEAAGPYDLARIWPRLAIVSCWADGPAEFAASNLKERLTSVRFQPKGLIATEAFVSLPFGGQHPLAINTHFFEFLEADGQIRLAEALEHGGEYEVVVTTGGGLWRYKLGDRVKVTGFVDKTPSIRFLGRGGSVSDQRGEKLSEAFVAAAMREVFGQSRPTFVLLAPDEDPDGARYTLYVQGRAQSERANTLDALLRKNPHYAYCRDLGQLRPIRLFRIADGAYEQFVRREISQGARLGDVKPAVLSKRTGWSKVFTGAYADTTLSNDR
jgi:GH3 auxin-responsive promoter